MVQEKKKTIILQLHIDNFYDSLYDKLYGFFIIIYSSIFFSEIIAKKENYVLIHCKTLASSSSIPGLTIRELACEVVPVFSDHSITC